MKNIIENIVVIVIMAVVMFMAFMYATSAEVWYAGMHDSKCEMNGNCHCCERLVKSEAVK